jgi:hypothetical protein
MKKSESIATVFVSEFTLESYISRSKVFNDWNRIPSLLPIYKPWRGMCCFIEEYDSVVLCMTFVIFTTMRIGVPWDVIPYSSR